MATSWVWLGDHLAVDFGNTVIDSDGKQKDLIDTVEAFSGWLAAEPYPLPLAEVRQRDLLRIRELRDTVLCLLGCAVRGVPLAARDVSIVNEAVKKGNVFRLLGDDAGRSQFEAEAGVDALLGVLAAATVDILARDDLTNLAICQAPGCKQFFHRSRPNQRWCSPGCGNRARVDRHRHRQGASVASQNVIEGGEGA